jgi:hypothetical protein
MKLASSLRRIMMMVISDASVDVSNKHVFSDRRCSRKMINKFFHAENPCSRIETAMHVRQDCESSCSQYCLGGEGF